MPKTGNKQFTFFPSVRAVGPPRKRRPWRCPLCRFLTDGPREESCAVCASVTPITHCAGPGEAIPAYVRRKLAAKKGTPDAA